MLKHYATLPDESVITFVPRKDDSEELIVHVEVPDKQYCFKVLEYDPINEHIIKNEHFDTMLLNFYIIFINRNLELLREASLGKGIFSGENT